MPAGDVLPVRHLLAYAVLAAAAWAPVGLLTARQPAPRLSVGLALLGLKATIWIAPALVLLVRVVRVPVPRALRLDFAGDRRGVVWALAASVAWLAVTAVLLQVTGAQRSAGLLWTAVVLTVVNALVEEVPFRGFLLGQLEGRMRFWRANLVQAALFVAVHWPGWIAQGLRVELGPSSVALGAFALVLGWVTHRSGTIWIAVALHAANNVLAE